MLSAAGDLDTTFGIGGKLLSQALPFRPTAIAMQPDGKFVAVGKFDTDFAIARVNPDGRLDLSFGKGGGMATTDFGGNRGDTAKGVAIQPDGKIVVVGHRANGASTIFGDPGQMAVARYNADGSLDKTFAKTGKEVIHLNTNSGEKAEAVALQPDGKIVIAGTGNAGAFSNSDFEIVRLNPDGTADRSFGSNKGAHRVGMGSDKDAAFVVKIAPDGRIVVGGENSNTIEASRSGTTWEILRLTKNGKDDTTFGKNGQVTVGGVGASLRDLAINPSDNSVVAVGESNENFMVERLNANGKPDSSFNHVGRAITDIFRGRDSAHTVQFMDRGRILVSGTSGGNSAMVMYRANGALDTTFGNQGMVVQDLGGRDIISNTRLTPDGKILATGVNHLGQIVQGRFLLKPTINPNIGLGGLTFVPRAMSRLFSDRSIDDAIQL